MRSYLALCAIFFCSATYAEIVTPGKIPTDPLTGADHTGFYIGGGLGYSAEDWSTEYGGDYSYDGMATLLIGGYHFTHWFGLESVFIFNTEEDALSSLGIAPKFTLQLNDNVALYIKLGFNFIIVGDINDDEGENSDFDDDDHDWDWDFDLIDLKFTGTTGASNTELDGDSGDGYGFSIGVGNNILITKGLHFRIGLEYLEAETEFDGSSDRKYDNTDVDHEVLTIYTGLYYQF